MEVIRVLVVEDQQLIREGLRVLLELAPQITVAGEARDGDEAIRLAAELDPDVVLMDVLMPGTNGIQATIAIKAARPGLAVLGLSGNDDDRYVFQMLDAGATGYLLHSTTAAELIRAIGIVHSGGTALGPSIASLVVNRLKTKQLSNYGDQFEGLSQREIAVLQIAANGKSSKDIGQALFISPHTVQAHMRNIYTKLEVGSRAEAVAHALRQGWIALDGRR